MQKLGRIVIAVLILVPAALALMSCDGGPTAPTVESTYTVPPLDSLPPECRPVKSGQGTVQVDKKVFRSGWVSGADPDLRAYPMNAANQPIGGTCSYQAWQGAWLIVGGSAVCILRDGERDLLRQIECFTDGNVAVQSCIITTNDPNTWPCVIKTYEVGQAGPF